MALTIFGVTVADGEKPYQASLDYSGQVIWYKATPWGYDGTIMRRGGRSAPEHTLKFYLLEATMQAFQTLVDSGADDNGSFIWNDGDLDINQTVTMERFRAKRGALEVAVGRWDCEMLLVKKST